MAKTWRRLPAKTRLRRVDEQANCIRTEGTSSSEFCTIDKCRTVSRFVFFLVTADYFLLNFKKSFLKPAPPTIQAMAVLSRSSGGIDRMLLTPRVSHRFLPVEFGPPRVWGSYSTKLSRHLETPLFLLHLCSEWRLDLTGLTCM
jgi:hypothetical protein